MESIPSTSVSQTGSNEPSHGSTSTGHEPKESTSGVFTCSYCSLQERFDFKGVKPPFARQITYLEECYVMKDPFSIPNKGEVLVLGADCSVCNKPVCLGCSIYFGKRFCSKCASNNIHYLPSQLHTKVKNLIKSTDS
ncbi:UPF0595 protein C22orf40 like protein [Dufourea novaeangliae]|uniref:Cysteine-rich DPF motif domain-containing protein 1 n=1 Tax=Dufourea novaeangliae TaxID=178035 RepID=A0A154P2V6_DUFNO|nr:UPF0595 protein C22orf40 like protein [Dufourea novaeangliae]